MMIIADIDYTEEELESLNIEGGRRHRRSQSSMGQSSFLSIIQPFLQSLNINPAASATVANLGGTSIGNTAISTNISMPIFIVVNQLGNGSPQIFW
ncbi:MAG TPA: hypothetical protein VL134_09775 [Leptolyngbya sp.]|jgi:hypothetical protein|nr:hypothetical protein [Leptolyngbya sp.]